MASKNSAQVLIGGKVITLSGYESSEYMQGVASYMNKKLAELSEISGYSRQPMETKHLLLSLNITDDYFKARQQAEAYEQDLMQKDQELYDLKHELVKLQMKLAKLEETEDAGSAKEIENEVE